jgi:hypothetical protein
MRFGLQIIRPESRGFHSFDEEFRFADAPDQETISIGLTKDVTSCVSLLPSPVANEIALRLIVRVWSQE